MHPHQTPTVVSSPLTRSCCFVVPPWHARLLGSCTIVEPRCFRETPRRLSETVRAHACPHSAGPPTLPRSDAGLHSVARDSLWSGVCLGAIVHVPLQRMSSRGASLPHPCSAGFHSPLLLELLLNPRTPPLITQNHPRSFLLCSKQTPSLLRPCTSGVDGAEASLLSLLFMLPTKPLLVLSVSRRRSSAPFINPVLFLSAPFESTLTLLSVRSPWCRTMKTTERQASRRARACATPVRAAT